MNIVKAQNMLKGASDEVLQRYLSSPTGEFPEYLVASEIKRREDMRQRFAASQQGQPSKASIIEEILQKSGLAANPPAQPPAMPQPPMPPEAMGIGSVPPPQDMQMSAPPMLEAMAQAPQRMYDGGVVALAEGGLLKEMQDYLSMSDVEGDAVGYAAGGGVDYYQRYKPSDASMYTETVPEVGDLSSYFTQAQGLLGSSGVAGYQDVLNEQRKEVEGRRKNYLPDFLIQAGLGMATSKSLSPIGAAAEGAAQGFDAYKKSKSLDSQAERDLRESEFKFKQAERAERAGVLGVSQKLYESAQTQRNRAIDNNRAAEEARITALYRGDQAANDAARLGISRQELGIRAAGVAREREVADEQILTSRARRGLIEQQTKYVGVKTPTLKDITALANSSVGQDALKAIRAAHGVTKTGKDPATDLVVNQAFQDWLLENSAKYASPFVGLSSTE
jgi:hypothetical protein